MYTKCPTQIEVFVFESELIELDVIHHPYLMCYFFIRDTMNIEKGPPGWLYGFRVINREFIRYKQKEFS
ncbi:hypothetical protein K4L44_07245 [Halosquirtibacter laminarini]|uniref:Uncharacterized protein n=1 Tax=Halosquirtibacter laminarini TaxID=3374600 RepID=A0AC61NQ02_9BACT|nr:hypothetical protein K4L44_07245 [Prolixibacteraceae bacterium]